MGTSFKMASDTEGSDIYAKQLAGYVQTFGEVYEAIYANADLCFFMGFVAPFLFGFVWAVRSGPPPLPLLHWCCSLCVGVHGCLFWQVLLWLFAGIIVYAALLSLLLMLVLGAGYLYVKAGWVVVSLDCLQASDLTPRQKLECFSVDASAIGEFTASINGSAAAANLTDASSAAGSLAAEMQSASPTTIYALCAIALTIFCIIYTILLVLWRKLIKRCIAIIKESTGVFKSLPALMFYSPVVNIFFKVLLLLTPQRTLTLALTLTLTLTLTSSSRCCCCCPPPVCYCLLLPVTVCGYRCCCCSSS